MKSNLKQLAKEIKVPISGPGSLTAIGEFIRKRIVGSTRLGYSLAGNPATPREKRLSPLSPRYIGMRKGFAKRGIDVHESFRPGRSQLTVTGQMLDSIKYVVNPQKETVRVFVSPTMRRGESNTNVDVARENIKRGRPFMGLDAQGQETIVIRYVKALYRRLK